MKGQGLSLFPLQKKTPSLCLCLFAAGLSALHFCISNSKRQRNENNLWNSMRRAREREKMKVNKSQRLMTRGTKMVLCMRYCGDGVCVEGWPRVAVPFVPPPHHPPKGSSREPDDQYRSHSSCSPGEPTTPTTHHFAFMRLATEEERGRKDE